MRSTPELHSLSVAPLNQNTRATAYRDIRTKFAPTVTVPINSLRETYSPRVDGGSAEHVRALAELLPTLPPIVVHRATMRVIDGMHRVQAAMLCGNRDIHALFFDGNEADAFVLAVESNVAHGLPLSLSDRVAAAERIIGTHPQWSDRAIASTTGLSAKTVSAARRRITVENAQSNIRIGRDGRKRPLDNTEGRRIASDLIARDPGMSLRKIASAAGISLGTARSIRERLRRNDNPVSTRQHGVMQNRVNVNLRHRKIVTEKSTGYFMSTVVRLSKDPALRFTEQGRALLRLLTVCDVNAVKLAELAESIPEHCIDLVAGAASDCANKWQKFASKLERRTAKLHKKLGS